MVLNCHSPTSLAVWIFPGSRREGQCDPLAPPLVAIPYKHVLDAQPRVTPSASVAMTSLLPLLKPIQCLIY